MITIRNNNQENTIRKAKSSKNFHPDDLLVPIPTKKQLIIDFIKQVISTKGKCTYSQSSIANMFNVTQKYVNKIYKELKEDPTFSIVTFKIAPKKNHTCIVKFVFLISLLLSAKCLPLSFNKNNKKVNSSLYVNTPISPKGATAVLENKPRKEKKTINEERETLILELGRKYKWHFKNQTLKLFAYPTHIIKKASEELSSAMKEYERERQGIRSTYRYMKKLLDTFMQRAGLSPLWILYYRKLKNPPQYKAAHPKAPSPSSAAPLPRYQMPRISTRSGKVGDILKELLAPQNIQRKSSVAESYSETKVNAHKPLIRSPNVKFDAHTDEKINEFKRMLVASSGTRDFNLRKVLVEYCYRSIFNEKPTDDKLKEYGFA